MILAIEGEIEMAVSGTKFPISDSREAFHIIHSFLDLETSYSGSLRIQVFGEAHEEFVQPFQPISSRK